MENLAKRHKVIPVFSFNAASIDSRFGEADAFLKSLGLKRIETLTLIRPHPRSPSKRKVKASNRYGCLPSFLFRYRLHLYIPNR